MSEIYTREFTGTYYSGSPEERRVELQRELAEVCQELHQVDTLYREKAAAIYALHGELQAQNVGRFHALKAERLQSLVSSRDVLLTQLVALRAFQRETLSDISTVNRWLTHHNQPGDQFVHELNYTRVKPELMMMEQDETPAPKPVAPSAEATETNDVSLAA